MKEDQLTQVFPPLSDHPKALSLLTGLRTSTRNGCQPDQDQFLRKLQASPP